MKQVVTIFADYSPSEAASMLNAPSPPEDQGHGLQEPWYHCALFLTYLQLKMVFLTPDPLQSHPCGLFAARAHSS